MGERPLTELGLRMIGDLPPVLQGSADYQAAIHPMARELERAEGMVEQVRAQFVPGLADVLLSAWEYMVRLPVGGSGGSIAQRRGKVQERMLKLTGQAEGRQWVAQIDELVGPGWAYREHDPADGTSPPAGTVSINLPYPPAGSAYAEALEQIREITPAHILLEFSSTAGFVLDESELDRDAFGGF